MMPSTIHKLGVYITYYNAARGEPKRGHRNTENLVKFGGVATEICV